MNVVTTRFGPIQVRELDVVQVPEGLVGFRGTTQFVLWPDSEVHGLAWLQSTADPDLAFALVPPQLAVSDYRVDLRPGDRTALELDEAGEPLVYVILNRGEQGLTVNLQGPLVFNLARRLGRQLVLTSSRYAVRFPLGEPEASPAVLPRPSALRATA